MENVFRQESDLSCQDRAHVEQAFPIILIPDRQSRVGMAPYGAAVPHLFLAVML